MACQLLARQDTDAYHHSNKCQESWILANQSLNIRQRHTIGWSISIWFRVAVGWYVNRRKFRGREWGVECDVTLYLTGNRSIVHTISIGRLDLAPSITLYKKPDSDRSLRGIKSMLVSKVFHQSNHRKAILLVKRCECRPAIFDLPTSQQVLLYEK